MSEKESSGLDAFLGSKNGTIKERKNKKTNKEYHLQKPKVLQSSEKKKNDKGGAIGFKDKLWAAADKMRNNMDATEYKNVVLGLIFLKYISDAFESKHRELQKEEFANPEDDDEYAADNIFWVPKEGRWSVIKKNAKDPKIGIMVDNAMVTIEKANPKLKGVLPKIYARQELDKIVLGGVIDLISDIGLGGQEDQARDILGYVYEYFLGKFAQQEGKGGGEYFTPTSIVRLIVAMIQPFQGRVYDPCCGSGGMFVQSERFVEVHGGKTGDISIYGQESNSTTWKLARMNLAIRGIEANLGSRHADSFHNDLHPSLKADYIMANPPFNVKDWGQERIREDFRWRFGIPPKRNANYAWIQHFIHHLSPHGVAGFVLANGSLTSIVSAEKEIREAIIRNGLIDCIINLPPQLFLTTQIPACLWFINRNKTDSNYRNRKNEILFIDTSDLGFMIDRKTRELSDEDIKLIVETYKNWKSISQYKNYKDVLGFSKSATLKEVEKNNFILHAGRYVGVPIEIEDWIPYEQKLKSHFIELKALENEGNDLSKKINEKISKLIEHSFD